MIRNYFTVAIRHILRHKAYTFINMFGLSFGLACCLLISLYILYEHSYDRYHENATNIYRVVEDVVRAGEPVALASAAAPLGPRLADEFPGVVNAVRLKSASMLMRHKDKRFQEENIYFADPAIFSVFTFPLLKGDPNTALIAPGSIALSASAARKYFGEEDPIGQQLIIDTDIPFTVKAIFEDVPPNSHLRFDFLISFSTLEPKGPGSPDSWMWSVYTYIQLAPDLEATDLEKKLAGFVMRQQDDDLLKKHQHRVVTLQALTDIHLRSHRAGEPSSGSLSRMYMFGSVGVFILLIAYMNFINLATSQAAQRAKEVGIRKVVGGTRTQLIWQFLAETLLLTAGASIVALAIYSLLLPVFNDLMGITLDAALLARPLHIAAFIAISLVVGLSAGSYPAFVLSAFRPAKTLKPWTVGASGGDLLRKTLTVFQFSISIVLIAGTMTVFSQLQFMQQQDPGYNRKHVLVLSFGDDDGVQQNVESIKQELLRSSYVDQAAASSHVPGRTVGARQVEAEHADGVLRPADMRVMAADHEFIAVYKIRIVAGRSFSPAFGSDATRAFMINEAAARKLGYLRPSDAIGRHLTLEEHAGTIVGVVSDFHYASLHQHIEPLVIRMRTRSLSYISLPLQGAIPAALGDLENKWRIVAPNRPFDYFFLDEQFDRQYRADRQFGNAFGASAVIAIILACLGLAGLVSFLVHKRTKEIGIRKVLGASAGSVTLLLSENFIRPVLIAMVIATPVAWYMLSQWLQDFAYHIQLSWWLFLLAGLIAVIIALASITIQSVQAALMDPVKSLRSE